MSSGAIVSNNFNNTLPPAYIQDNKDNTFTQTLLGKSPKPVTSPTNGHSDKVLIGCLVISRHVASIANLTKQIAGSGLDSPPSVQGIKQGIQLVQVMKKYFDKNKLFISRVYTSLMTRAYYTALQLAAASPLEWNKPAITQSPELNEINWGSITGMTLNQARKAYGAKFDELKKDISPYVQPLPGGETLWGVYKRAYPFFKKQVLNPVNFIPYDLHGNLPTVVLAIHSNLIKALLFGMLRDETLTNISDHTSYDIGNYLAENARPLVFRVYQDYKGGLTLEATQDTVDDIDESIEKQKNPDSKKTEKGM